MEHLVFKALGDPTRRAIFEKLAQGPLNATQLREGIPVSQPAMSQHLALLREAGLIRQGRNGKYVDYEVEPGGILAIARWLERYRAYWPARVSDLRTLLKEMDQ
jgi:DNA-binding transcriptional ArsR family regulator